MKPYVSIEKAVKDLFDKNPGLVLNQTEVARRLGYSVGGKSHRNWPVHKAIKVWVDLGVLKEERRGREMLVSKVE